MITINENRFALETAHTGYYLAVRDGLAENLHYGARVRIQNPEPLRQKTDIGYGSDVIRHPSDKTISLDHLCLELSPLQKGDYRTQSLSILVYDESAQRPGGYTVDLSFACARKLEGSVPPRGLPGAFGGAETLALEFTSPQRIGVTLYYIVYPECDVITRRLCVQNNAAGPITLQKAMSYQLDLPGSGYVLSTLNGAWARERHPAETPLWPARTRSAAPRVRPRRSATRFSF